MEICFESYGKSTAQNWRVGPILKNGQMDLANPYNSPPFLVFEFGRHPDATLLPSICLV